LLLSLARHRIARATPLEGGIRAVDSAGDDSGRGVRREQIAVQIVDAPPRTACAWPNVAIVCAEYRYSW